MALGRMPLCRRIINGLMFGRITLSTIMLSRMVLSIMTFGRMTMTK
jgi:hypothetical protein